MGHWVFIAWRRKAMRYYMHRIPGRLRIKIPEIKGHPDKAGVIQALLRDVDGIESIRANTITGSVVVKYEPGRSLSERILSILTENGFFDKTNTFGMDHAVYESSSKVGEALSKAFCGWAVGRALEGNQSLFSGRVDLIRPTQPFHPHRHGLSPQPLPGGEQFGLVGFFPRKNQIITPHMPVSGQFSVEPFRVQ